MALLLNVPYRGVSLYRAIYYLPSLVGGSVAVAVMWRQIFGPDGLINQVLAMVGVQGLNWLGNLRFGIWTLIVLAAWQFGSPMLMGFKDLEMGYASALAWTLLMSVAFFTVLIFRSSAWWVHYEAKEGR
ncbi:MAG: sugar ABC transporter permease [Firmicutes bacterium]|nr:sugar ABC transporter permease [Bacillota bacterium]